jgi:hypothetical protein
MTVLSKFDLLLCDEGGNHQIHTKTYFKRF